MQAPFQSSHIETIGRGSGFSCQKKTGEEMQNSETVCKQCMWKLKHGTRRQNPRRTPVLLSVPESCSLSTLLADAGLNNFMIRHNTGLSKLDGTLQTLNRLGGSLVLFLQRTHVSIQRTCQALHAEVCLEALQCYSNLLVKV